MLTSVKLAEHLNDVDLRAREMEEKLIKELAEEEVVINNLGDKCYRIKYLNF